MVDTEHEVLNAEKRMAAKRDKGFAVSARYDHGAARIVVALNTGVEIAFPTRLAEGLADASADELADIEISPAGLGLHWPKLDIDLYVPALLEGAFGSKRWMAAQLGAAGGRAQSPAKTEAARENGRKGGRPRKLDPLAKLAELVMATYDERKPAKAKLTADQRRALTKELKIAESRAAKRAPKRAPAKRKSA
jgi:Protein of unknown function (DUF2442)